VNLYIVEDGKLVPYERLGECKQCGECCRKKITFQWYVAKPQEDDADPEGDWLYWEGYSLIFARGAYWYIKVTGVKDPKADDERVPCWSLDGSLCSIHGDQFKMPPLCPLWPVHPKDLLPGCGYSFVRG